MMENMHKARKLSNEIKDKAIEARQKAIRLQFNANSAVDMAALAAEILASSKDDAITAKLAAASRETIWKAIECIEVAAIAVDNANRLYQEDTFALRNCKSSAVRLLEALYKLETQLGNY